MGGAHHFPLVGTPRSFDFGVGSRTNGLSEGVMELFWTSDVLLGREA